MIAADGEPTIRQYVKAEYAASTLTGRIIAAPTEIHRSLGPGFEEVIHQRALARELPAHGLECSREVWIDVTYKGMKRGRKRVDFVIGARAEPHEVLVEIKAKAALEDVAYIQTLSYLKASSYRIGPLINLGRGGWKSGDLRIESRNH